MQMLTSAHSRTIYGVHSISSFRCQTKWTSCAAIWLQLFLSIVPTFVNQFAKCCGCGFSIKSTAANSFYGFNFTRPARRGRSRNRTCERSSSCSSCRTSGRQRSTESLKESSRTTLPLSKLFGSGFDSSK